MKTDIEIAGITTVYREAAKRAHIVRRLLELAGRNDIPVFAGASKPLSEGARILGVLNYGEESAEEEDDGGLAAVKFIADCAGVAVEFAEFRHIGQRHIYAGLPFGHAVAVHPVIVGYAEGGKI